MCECCRDHREFLHHTAEMIVGTAAAAHPSDPVAAAEMALRAVGYAKLPTVEDQRGAGPDYGPETETAWEGRRDQEDQETTP